MAVFDSDVQFEPLNAKTATLFQEYESNVSMMDREAYLEYLFALPNVWRNGESVGTIHLHL